MGIEKSVKFRYINKISPIITKIAAVDRLSMGYIMSTFTNTRYIPEILVDMSDISNPGHCYISFHEK